MAFCSSPASAQDSPGRVELGGSLTAVRDFNLPGSIGPGFETDLNLGRHFALDSTLDWLPSTNSGGNTLVGLFGAKAGMRTERFGYFVKVRPGFITQGNVLRDSFANETSFSARDGRLTERALDLGGVLEYYPARHWALRWDLGDLLIFHGEGPTFIDTANGVTLIQRTPGQTRSNLRFSTALHYRF